MFCGIDLGSRQVKIALMEGDSLVGSQLYDTISFYKHYGRKVENKLAIDFSALGIESVEYLVSTGYGRNTLDIQGAQKIPELKAHTLGAVWQTGLEEFTLLDLGGQDSKVIKVRKGKMVDFQTNDKCAASSGRYLENMAGVLGIDLAELSRYSEDPVDLSATCAIFGESELIGRIIEGHELSRLGAGINYSIFRRIQPMLRDFYSQKLVFTGGVAQNQALQEIIQREMNCQVIVPTYPQLNGAIGCCIAAREIKEKGEQKCRKSE